MTAEHACSYVGGAGRDNRQDTSGSAPHLGWRMCIGACACVGRRKMMSQPSRGCHNNPMDWNPGKMNNRPKLHPNYKCASAHSLWNPSAHTSRSSQRRAFSNTINSVRHCAAMYAQLLRSKGCTQIGKDSLKCMNNLCCDCTTASADQSMRQSAATNSLTAAALCKLQTLILKGAIPPEPQPFLCLSLLCTALLPGGVDCCQHPRICHAFCSGALEAAQCCC